jgi:uncharacterized protein (DUF1697 family)
VAKAAAGKQSQSHVALLRAINVGGRNLVGMTELRALVEKLGFEDGRTLLQSGNLVFAGDGRPTAELEALLEGATKKRFGVETDYFVRTAAEWDAVVAGNPFPAEAKRDPAHLLVLFMKDAPTRAAVSALEAAIVGREVVRARGKHLYMVYPDGVGRSKLTNVLVEKKLGTRGTGRNWNTVLKLAALAGA